jgi:glycosyltransferase involved in cell wall biosynthesis
MSAISQDYIQKEIIVCDNNSSDDTKDVARKIIREWPKVDIKFVSHSQNLGMVSNWRECLKRVSGEFYMILDDDNYLEDKTYLSKAAFLIGNNPNIKLVFSNFKLLTNKATMLRVFTSPSVTNGLEFYKDYFNRRIMSSIFFTILNTETATKYDFYSDDIVTHDTQSFLICMLLGDVGYIRTCSGVYDLRGQDNLSHDLGNHMLDYFLFHTKILRVGEKNGIGSDLLFSPLLQQSSECLWSLLRTGRIVLFAQGLRLLLRDHGLLKVVKIILYMIFFVPIRRLTASSSPTDIVIQ